MAPQDPPPAPQATPSTKYTRDRLAAVLGNATLLGIGYVLLRRPRLAIVSLTGSIVLLALIALYPHLLAWRVLLPVWWAFLVLHAWLVGTLGGSEPLLSRRGWNPVWRNRVLAAVCLVCVLFGWLRFDAWTIVREAEAAHTDGDCDRAEASLRWLGAPHDLAHGSLASRGELQREACELVIEALAESDRSAAAADLGSYLDHPGALWDGAGPERAELLLDEVVAVDVAGVEDDEDLTEGDDPTLATLEDAFTQLSATLQDTPGQSERVRVVVESFLTNLDEVPPCDAKAIDEWLLAQTWQEPELTEPIAPEEDHLPGRMFGCAQDLRGTDSDAAATVYQEFMTAYPEHERAAEAAEDYFANADYCERPAAYPGAPPYEGSGPHAMRMLGMDPDEYDFPDSWQADGVDETALVVCVEGPEQGSYQQTCYYEPGEDQLLPLYGTAAKVDFYASEFTVKAYEFRTGELVEDYSEEIGDPCPDELQYDSLYFHDSVPSEHNSDYSDAELRSVFDRLMD